MRSRYTWALVLAWFLLVSCAVPSGKALQTRARPSGVSPAGATATTALPRVATGAPTVPIPRPTSTPRWGPTRVHQPTATPGPSPAPGEQANGTSRVSSISANGRWVAFESEATKLVAGDTNQCVDIFVHDRQTGQTKRASIASDGTQADAGSFDPAISADGRWVAFYSGAENLAPGDTNGYLDIFLRDQTAGTTDLVSAARGGGPADGPSYAPAISADGRFVALVSRASNLVISDTNHSPDAFVYDRDMRTVERVSVATGGGQADGGAEQVSISADGRWVAFVSIASNLVQHPVGRPATQVYVHDRVTGRTDLVSATAAGDPGENYSSGPAISADGRWVAFGSAAADLAPGGLSGWAATFLRDRDARETYLVAGYGFPPEALLFGERLCSISPDGRWLTFESAAGEAAPAGAHSRYDVFVYDSDTRTTERVSVGPGGAAADDDSSCSSISADGRYVAFGSSATNLVAGDTNGVDDVFVYDRVCGTTERVSVASR